MSTITFSGSNINLVKAHNLKAILMTLLYEKHISRTQLAEKTDLSTTTITNLVAELLQQGVVVEEGIEEDMGGGRRRVGRPRTVLSLVPNARYAIGMHVGVGTVRLALTNLAAEVLARKNVDFEITQPPERVFQQIAIQSRQMIAASGVNPRNILGIGVGASGLVDFSRGVDVLAPTLGWRNVPVRSILEDELHLPTTVDNNVRAMALGEARFGAGRGMKVVAFVYGRKGVGSGYIVDGQIYHGSFAGAGEIGHVTILPTGGEQCRCGNTGCLETLISEPVLVKEAERLAAENPDSLLAGCLKAPGDDKPIDRLFIAARAGDPIINRLLVERAEYLGIALANLINMINPEVIILGGIFAQGFDLFAPTLEQTIRKRAFPGLGDIVRLQPTSFGWSAGVVGAAALALDAYFYQRSEAN